MTSQAMLAAIPFAQDSAVDTLLSAVARSLKSQGIRVSGCLQHAETVDGQWRGAVDVEDIETGERLRIMQPLGQHARGCRLDPQAMAEVSAKALASLERRPQILILNRFGKGEAEGAGLRTVFEAAALAGIPVLTSVKEPYLPDWDLFSDSLSVRLDADEAQIAAWCLGAVSAAGNAARAA
jgi:nucleoside-triphosphatase THEP1